MIKVEVGKVFLGQRKELFEEYSSPPIQRDGWVGVSFAAVCSIELNQEIWSKPLRVRINTCSIRLKRGGGTLLQIGSA